MALTVENRSSKIIGFGGISILPGELKEIPEEFENNPILETYEKIGHIKVTGTKTAVVKKDSKETKKALEEEKAEALRLSRLAMLPGISEEDLGRLANELGINPAECKDQADVLKKVKAALKK